MSGAEGPPPRLWWVAYRLLLWSVFPGLWVRLWWRGKTVPQTRQLWRQRLGWCPRPPAAHGIWVHAVSAGEANTAALLVRELLRRDAAAVITLTTMTPTGRERGMALLGDSVHHVYAAYDYPRAVARFLDRVEPRLAVFIETELWPNTLAACRARGIGTLLANARLSAGSARGYARLGSFGTWLLAQLDVVACQFEAHLERFRQLGVPPARLHVTGSLKFDFVAPPDLAAAAARLRTQWGIGNRPIWVAGSTHPGEERIVLDAHRRVLAQLPDCLLLLAPRHPQRAPQVDLAGPPLRVALRAGGVPTADSQVVICDRMGELLLWYALAQVAFVGGSLIDRGGHNPIEPAALGLPVLMGRSAFNFVEVAAAFAAAGALQWIGSGQAGAVAGDTASGNAGSGNLASRNVASGNLASGNSASGNSASDNSASGIAAASLAAAVVALLRDPAGRQRRGAAGQAVIASHRGATGRLADIVGRWPAGDTR